jgi:hypothetical protein
LRAVLAGAAAVPALAVPVVVELTAKSDAELIALGEKFDALEAIYDDASRRSEPRDEVFSKMLRQLKERQGSGSENDGRSGPHRT